MKYAIKNSLLLITTTLFVSSCGDILDTKYDDKMLENQINETVSKMQDLGIAAYTYIPSGFTAIDNNLFAAATDEAEYVTNVVGVEKFNNGTWNQHDNPADCYAHYYKGIRSAYLFLEETENFKEILAYNRDTVTWNGKDSYRKNCENIEWLRYENRFLICYFYFELIKRYGDIPFVDKVLKAGDNTDLPKTKVDWIVQFIADECDKIKEHVCGNWKVSDVSRDGRVSKGGVLMLKAKALLFMASKLNNPSNDLHLWERAADAVRELIDMDYYVLDSKYSNLFLVNRPGNSKEVIFALRLGETNDFEKANYPIATPGGATGICPSQNLVEAYEMQEGKTFDSQNPYLNRDPRLLQTVVVNNSTWTGRTIQIWNGGLDARPLPNRTRTGYYLKKFVNDNLDLQQDAKKLRSWIVYRYADALLMYAEAMNMAYGPDADPYGDGKTARWAINTVRNRSDVKMPSVTAIGVDEMYACIKHERRVELAFEDQRYWDLLRWMDAEKVLNEPVRGVEITNTGGVFGYSEYVVEERRFLADRMYRFPFPQVEVGKSKGNLIQNAGW